MSLETIIDIAKLCFYRLTICVMADIAFFRTDTGRGFMEYNIVEGKMTPLLPDNDRNKFTNIYHEMREALHWAEQVTGIKYPNDVDWRDYDELMSHFGWDDKLHPVFKIIPHDNGIGIYRVKQTTNGIVLGTGAEYHEADIEAVNKKLDQLDPANAPHNIDTL